MLPKVGFFAWETIWGKALTLDKVQRRVWFLANKCFLYQNNEESIDHILVCCAKTRVLWLLLFVLFGVSWMLSS